MDIPEYLKPFKYDIGLLEMIKRNCEVYNILGGWSSYNDGRDCGFVWSETIERHAFWEKIFEDLDVSGYYERYPTSEIKIPKYLEFLREHPQILKRVRVLSDLFETFERDVNGAFVFSSTSEGHMFWKDVLENKNVDRYYKKYPKHAGVRESLEILKEKSEVTPQNIEVKLETPHIETEYKTELLTNITF